MTDDQRGLLGCYGSGRYAVTTVIWSPYSELLPIVLAQFDRLTEAVGHAISEARRRSSACQVQDWISEARRQTIWETG